MNAQHVGWVRLGAMIAGFLMAASALLSPAGAQGPAPSGATATANAEHSVHMGDDIGWMRRLHRSLALGATPSIDRIGQEGAIFTHHERPPSGLLLAKQ